MSNDTRFAITLLGALTALTALAAPAQPLRAAGTDDVTVTLDRPTALEWRRKLDDARPLSTLEVLGLQDEAELEPVVPVPMRDGIRLSATVILPKSQAGRKLPVILLRSPYRPDAEVSEPLASKLLPHLVRNGYAVVIVNDRGTQWSEGSYQWLKGANQDGSDTLDWIIRQPWSDGKVGTFGCSSSGESQPPLATLNHPAHKAMVEMAGATAAGCCRLSRSGDLLSRGSAGSGVDLVVSPLRTQGSAGVSGAGRTRDSGTDRRQLFAGARFRRR